MLCRSTGWRVEAFVRVRGAVAGVLLALALMGCTAKDSTIVGHYPGPLALQDWRTIARTTQPRRGEILRVVDAGRSESLSNHIVIVRSRELPHWHNHQDATITILEGRGTMVVGREKRPVSAGAVLFIPRGTVHHYTNESVKPSVALVVFAPPFDGQDREVLQPDPGETPPQVEGDETAAGEGAPAPELPGKRRSSPGAVPLAPEND